MRSRQVMREDCQMKPNVDTAPAGGSRLVRRGALVVAFSAVPAAAILSVAVMFFSLRAEGRPFDEALRAAPGGLLFLGPYLLIGVLVLFAAGAGFAVLITLASTTPRTIRAQRIVWARTYVISVTAVLVGFAATTIASAPLLLVAVAVVAAILYFVSYLVFSVSDRRSLVTR